MMTNFNHTTLTKYSFRFIRSYTTAEGFDRIIQASSLLEAEAAATKLAREFDENCPYDCSEIEGGLYEETGSFDFECTSSTILP